MHDRRDPQHHSAMQTGKIPFTDEVTDVTSPVADVSQAHWRLVRHHGIPVAKYSFLQICKQLLNRRYNFGAKKVQIAHRIAGGRAEVEPRSTSVIIHLRHLRELSDGCDLGISRFRGCLIPSQKCFCESRFDRRCLRSYGAELRTCLGDTLMHAYSIPSGIYQE